MMELLRLGLRLTSAGGRSGWIRVALMASGAAVASFLLLTTVGLISIVDAQESRDAATVPVADGGATDLVIVEVADGWGGREIRRVAVAVIGEDLPLPPGVDRLPAAGEVILSPALARLATRELLVGQRFPQRVVGTVAPEGLVEPDQLIAYVGVRPDQVGSQAMGVTGFGSPAGHSVRDPRAVRTVAMLVLVFMLVPLSVFLATCARLSATGREQRLAALRLLGLGPGRTQFVNAIENAVAAMLGSVIGLLLWWIWRSTATTARVGRFSWFIDDMTVSLVLGVIVFVAPIVLALFVGAVASRQAVAQPMRTRRERSTRSVSRWRAVPFLGGVALLSMSWRTAKSEAGPVPWMLLFTAGLIATGIGTTLLVPAVARLTGALLSRIPRPSALLAGRRLQHEPANAGRIIAGLAVAIFAGGFGQAILVALDSVNDYEPGLGPGPVVNLEVIGPPVAIDADPYRQLSTVDASAALITLADGSTAVVADCATARTLSNAALPFCTDGNVYTVTSGVMDYSAHGISSGLLGLPTPVGELVLDVWLPDGLITPSLLIPVGLVGVPVERWIVGFDTASLDPQVMTAELFSAQPGARWNPSITDVSSNDASRIYMSMVAVGITVALLIGLAAMIIATVDAALERRAPLARLAALGTSPRTIRLAHLLQTIPVGVIVLGAAGFGALIAGMSYLRWGSSDALSVPIRSLVLITGIAIAGGVLSSVAGLLATQTRPAPEFLRTE